MNTSVTVFLPGLLPNMLLDKENLLAKHSFTALCTLLSKASRTVAPQTVSLGKGKVIKTFFQGLELGAIPSGPLGALGQGLIAKEEKNTWCQIAPIACHLDQKAAYLLGDHALAISQAESDSLIAQLNTLLQQDGFLIKAANTTDWYCRVPKQKDVVMNDLLEVLHKNMAFLLPSGPDEVYWRRLLTECQMLLAQHPVNLARQSDEKPFISSVWFWGIGDLPSTITTRFSQIYTDCAIVKGLGILAATPVFETQKAFDSPFDSNVFLGKHTLLHDHLLYRYHQYSDHKKWLSLLAHYEAQWFKPLLESVKQGAIDSLKIILGDQPEFVITKKQLKYFWRSIKSLEALVTV